MSVAPADLHLVLHCLHPIHYSAHLSVWLQVRHLTLTHLFALCPVCVCVALTELAVVVALMLKISLVSYLDNVPKARASCLYSFHAVGWQVLRCQLTLLLFVATCCHLRLVPMLRMLLYSNTLCRCRVDPTACHTLGVRESQMPNTSRTSAKTVDQEATRGKVNT